MTGYLSADVYISVFSGWGTEYYLATQEANTGSYQWTVPGNLDPSLDYDIYIQSVDDGSGNPLCWRYANLVILPL